MLCFLLYPHNRVVFGFIPINAGCDLMNADYTPSTLKVKSILIACPVLVFLGNPTCVFRAPQKLLSFPVDFRLRILMDPKNHFLSYSHRYLIVLVSFISALLVLNWAVWYVANDKNSHTLTDYHWILIADMMGGLGQGCDNDVAIAT